MVLLVLMQGFRLWWFNRSIPIHVLLVLLLHLVRYIRLHANIFLLWLHGLHLLRFLPHGWHYRFPGIIDLCSSHLPFNQVWMVCVHKFSMPPSVLQRLCNRARCVLLVKLMLLRSQVEKIAVERLRISTFYAQERIKNMESKSLFQTEKQSLWIPYYQMHCTTFFFLRPLCNNISFLLGARLF